MERSCYGFRGCNRHGITAPQIYNHGLVDGVIEEPLGGAHRNFNQMCIDLKTVLENSLSEISNMTIGDLLERRFDKFMAMGACD